MAKFCSTCGKELVDGKCSDCGSKASNTPSNNSKGFGDILKEYWDLLKESIKKPFDVVKNNNTEDNLLVALISMGVTSILGGVFMCAIIKSLFGEFGDFVDIPYFKVWLCGFLVFAILFVAMALVGYLIFDKCFKANTSIKKMFVLVGLSQITLSFAVAIITILGFILSGDNAETITNIIFVVLLFATSLWTAILIKGSEHYIGKIDTNKFVYAYAILYSIVIIITYLCIKEIIPTVLK